MQSLRCPRQMHGQLKPLHPLLTLADYMLHVAIEWAMSLIGTSTSPMHAYFVAVSVHLVAQELTMRLTSFLWTRLLGELWKLRILVLRRSAYRWTFSCQVWSNGGEHSFSPYSTWLCLHRRALSVLSIWAYCTDQWFDRLSYYATKSIPRAFHRNVLGMLWIIISWCSCHFQLTSQQTIADCNSCTLALYRIIVPAVHFIFALSLALSLIHLLGSQYSLLTLSFINPLNTSSWNLQYHQLR